jgi:hypothetical protein
MIKPDNKKARLILAFFILCGATFSILYTGPGFSFVWQVVFASALLFVLFWLVT